MREVFFVSYLLTYRSLTYAQRSARVLERAGITASVSRVPRSVSRRGCAYCVVIPTRHRERALALLDAASLRPERVLLRRADGSVEEAEGA